MKFQDYLRDRLQNDAEFRAEWDALEPEYAFRNALTHARIANGFTQQELADHAGMQRSVIARLESGNVNPTLTTLERLATALNVTFEVTPTAGVQIHDPVKAD